MLLSRLYIIQAKGYPFTLHFRQEWQEYSLGFLFSSINLAIWHLSCWSLWTPVAGTIRHGDSCTPFPLPHNSCFSSMNSVLCSLLPYCLPPCESGDLLFVLIFFSAKLSAHFRRGGSISVDIFYRNNHTADNDLALKAATACSSKCTRPSKTIERYKC